MPCLEAILHVSATPTSILRTIRYAFKVSRCVTVLKKIVLVLTETLPPLIDCVATSVTSSSQQKVHIFSTSSFLSHESLTGLAEAATWRWYLQLPACQRPQFRIDMNLQWISSRERAGRVWESDALGRIRCNHVLSKQLAIEHLTKASWPTHH